MSIYNAESWIRSDGRRNNRWFPRDAGLLEESTGMGLSLSLLVAAVPFHNTQSTKPSFVNSLSLFFPHFIIYNFLFFFRMTCHFLRCLVFYSVKIKKDECIL